MESDDRNEAVAVEAARVGPAYVPRKRAGLLELDMGDGVVLYDPDASLVHHLNLTASLVWHLCDGRAAVGLLAAEMAEELSLSRPQIEKELLRLVAELQALGLVEEVRPADPADR